MEEILRQKIEQNGPLTVAEFMQTCLYHPQKGYYITKDPLGQGGDFTTAPEISQIFGELIGLWLADCWIKMGMPAKCTLLECGPGRGTLMADALRAIQQAIPSFLDALEIYMLETSPFLKQKQQKKLAAHPNIKWVESIEDVPLNKPTLVVGNEFLDAFPTQQFQKTETGWGERMVHHQNGEFSFITQPTSLTFSAESFYEESTNISWAQALKNKIATGYILFIDYGYTSGSGDTLQAIHAHETVHPLSHFGGADLTTHVNFAQLQKALGEQHCQLDTMGNFLALLGFVTRTAKLAEHVTKAEQETLATTAHRLLHTTEMGTLFKALCWRSQGLPAAEGFSTMPNVAE